MKTPAHIFVAFAVIVVLFFGYWGVSTVLESTHPTPGATQHSTSLGDEIPQEWVEGFDSLTTSENITSKLAQNISKDFISRDEEGTLVETPGSVLGKLDASIIKDPDQLASYISPQALGIQYELSDEALGAIVEDITSNQEQYWQEYLAVMNKVKEYSQDADMVVNALSEAASGGSSQTIDTMVHTYTAIVQELRAMRVPSNVKEFHKQNILFFENMIVVFKGVGYTQTDPLRAFVLLQYAPELVTSWEALQQSAEDLLQNVSE
jgi:hypothetical protein